MHAANTWNAHPSEISLVLCMRMAAPPEKKRALRLVCSPTSPSRAMPRSYRRSDPFPREAPHAARPHLPSQWLPPCRTKWAVSMRSGARCNTFAASTPRLLRGIHSATTHHMPCPFVLCRSLNSRRDRADPPFSGGRRRDSDQGRWRISRSFSPRRSRFLATTFIGLQCRALY